MTYETLQIKLSNQDEIIQVVCTANRLVAEIREQEIRSLYFLTETEDALAKLIKVLDKE